MYPVGDAQWLMYPVGDGGGEEDLCHVRSGGHSVTHVPSGRQGGEEYHCHVPSGPCTQWGTLSGLCTQWGTGEERRISAMYPVGDAQWLIYPVGDGGGREGSLPCTQWGTLSDTCP